jgi:hypothetical protein
MLGQVETRNDHACVAPALFHPKRATPAHLGTPACRCLLPSEGRFGTGRSAECLCHTILAPDHLFVIGSACDFFGFYRSIEDAGL